VSKNVTKEFVQHIQKWQTEYPKLVIGVEGYSGSGKTTLLNELTKTLSILVIHMDDFQVSDDARRKLESSTVPKTDVFVEKYRFDLLKDLVKKYRDGEVSATYELYDTNEGKFSEKEFVFDAPILIIEGVWLSNQDHLPNTFDKIVFLDVDHSVADARRRVREGQEWAADAREETHPDSHVKQYKLAYKTYMKKYRPDKNADLVIKNT